MRKTDKKFVRPAIAMLSACSALMALGTLSLGVAQAQATKSAAAPASIIGYWLTETRDSIVQIGNCGSRNICGMIRSYKGTGKETDQANADKTKRAKPICNLQIIGNLTPTKNGWQSGWVYDPETGDKYQLSVTLSGPNKAKLRAFQGTEAFGETLVWTRSPKVPNGCLDV